MTARAQTLAIALSLGVALIASDPAVAVDFGYPSAAFPLYCATHTFAAAEHPAFTLTQVRVDGVEVRDFEAAGLVDSTVRQEGYQRRYPRYGARVPDGADLDLTVRCHWLPGREHTIEVLGQSESGEPVHLRVRGEPRRGPGYWDPAWPHCAAVVLRETAGMARHQEPVHVKMALYSDRLTDPAREIRVVALRRQGGDVAYEEVPSQVYHVSAWDDPALTGEPEVDEATGQPIVRYLPTTTLEVAFFADVPARGEAVYLVFYGNPDAPAPLYETDLIVSGPEIGQRVANGLMEVDLDDASGAIFQIRMKEGPGAVLEHRLETNGAVHWNPGAYSPPHSWVHASDWQEVAFEQVSGPVFHMTKRHGPLPHMDQVRVTITYVFYAGKPYIVSSSLTEVVEEFHGKALRNGEIVFNHAALNTFAYRGLDGATHEVPIATTLRHPEHAVDIPYNVPWVAFGNPRIGIGFGAVALELAATNRYGGLSDAEQPYYYVANGPWIYFSRALNYSFGSNNTSRMIRCAAGSVYYEKTAFAPFLLGASEDPALRYAALDELSAELTQPLQVSYHLDTDNRNNTGWVVPILVEPFDEGVDGALGGGHGASAGEEELTVQLGETEYGLEWLTPAQVADLPWDEFPLRPGSPYGLHVHPLYNLQEDVPAAAPEDDDWVRVWRELARGLEGEVPTLCLVAREGDQMAGMIRCLPKRVTGARYGSWGQEAHREDLADDAMWIGAAYVDRQGAADGLDALLVTRVLKRARELGYRRVQALGWSAVRTYAQWGQSFPAAVYEAQGFDRIHRLNAPLNCLPDMLAGRHDAQAQQLARAELEAAGLTADEAETRWIMELNLD